MNQQEQKELQQKVIELNLLDQRFREVQQQINVIDQQLNEIQFLENNLDEISKTKSGSETLSQLGPGVFVKSKINETEEVFMDIGSKLVVKKTIGEAKELIKKRKGQVSRIRDLVLQELSDMFLNIQVLEKEIQERISKQEK